jgi:CMP-N-acetylneuraminic acid synthetase
MKPSATAFVFARGGSKGIPQKNLRLLNGKPLLAYAIETARASSIFQRVIVSTDSEEIAKVARNYGAETPFVRPSELATDESSEWHAWQHALKEASKLYGDSDVFVSLPATAPFRSVQDVINCVDRLVGLPAVDVVITACQAQRNPWYNMVKVDNDGFAVLAAKPENTIVRRQDAPRLFDVATVAYAAKPSFILQANGIWDGRVAVVEIPRERSLDIDTPFDLLIAESLVQASSVSH